MANQFRNYINGEWLPGSGWTANRNPSDLSDVIGEYAQANAEQAQQAIAAAVKAQAAWGLSTPQQRFDILDAAGAGTAPEQIVMAVRQALNEGLTTRRSLFARADRRAGRVANLIRRSAEK